MCIMLTHGRRHGGERYNRSETALRQAHALSNLSHRRRRPQRSNWQGWRAPLASFRGPQALQGAHHGPHHGHGPQDIRIHRAPAAGTQDGDRVAATRFRRRRCHGREFARKGADRVGRRGGNLRDRRRRDLRAIAGPRGPAFHHRSRSLARRGCVVSRHRSLEVDRDAAVAPSHGRRAAIHLRRLRAPPPTAVPQRSVTAARSQRSSEACRPRSRPPDRGSPSRSRGSAC